MVLSKSKLIPLLVEQGFISSEKQSVSYEAFGRQVFAFIRVLDMQTRERAERFLRDRGISFKPDYWPGKPYVQVRVSYFKAWHWDE